MKKPVNDYATNYPVEESESYYGNCESNNYSCDTDNYGGNGNGNTICLFL